MDTSLHAERLQKSIQSGHAEKNRLAGSSLSRRSEAHFFQFGDRILIGPFMTSYNTTTLFSDYIDCSQGSTPFAVSILIHTSALGIMFFGLIYAPPRIVNAPQSDRYSVSELVLQSPSHSRHNVSTTDTSSDTQRSSATATAAEADAAAAQLQAMRDTQNAGTASRTLIQPKVHLHLTLLRDADVPSLIIWMPDSAQVKHIVAPFATQPRVAAVTPSVSTPNDEPRPADISVRSTDHDTAVSPILSGTSSPARMQEPDLTQTTPLTVMQVSDKPTPVAIMSLSDLHIANGVAVLPPVNQSAGYRAQDAPAPNQASHPSTVPGHADGNVGGTRTGVSATEKPVARESGSASGNGDPLNSAGRPSATLITLTKNGHFESVVVGASLEDQFPEVEGFWSGRLLYTAYLHVGLAHSWILQYSLPRSDTAAAAGNVARLESPWPYSIVRPDLAPGSINADALMIKGFISQEGHFELPTLIFPPSFPLAQFVLNCLRQWQFRPAFQDGQPARVEILLIIPDSE
jgi:hypothetical protein